MASRIATRALAAAVAFLAVIAPLTVCASSTPTPSASRPSTTPDASSSSPGTSTEPSRSEYADGTHTVRGVYGGAPSYMTITITLADDTITDVTVEPMPENNDTSRGYQELFAATVPDEVIGKPIADLIVGKLARASGCADGFNDALTKIREQAGEVQ